MNREKTVEIPFGNKRVRLVGIDHGFELDKSRKENSDFDKRKGEYHKEIKQSDLVILEQPLEYFPDVEGSNIDFYQADFFKKIGKIAYNEKRPIYVCDPINFSAYSLNLDLANTLGQGNVQKYNSRYRLHEWR
ncbi:MAG: hypothetical protein PF542_03805, partial [Nanoarchaeota archaeon]|nr:hypothetical protein [Nanoarchaeota archaeon]